MPLRRSMAEGAFPCGASFGVVSWRCSDCSRSLKVTMAHAEEIIDMDAVFNGIPIHHTGYSQPPGDDVCFLLYVSSKLSQLELILWIRGF